MSSKISRKVYGLAYHGICGTDYLERSKRERPITHSKIGSEVSKRCTMHPRHQFWKSIVLICLVFECASHLPKHWNVIAAASEPNHGPVKVVNSHRLPADNIPTKRIPLGIPGDYKPWVAQLPNNDLLIVAFYGRSKNGKNSERAVFWRSGDGGNSWDDRDERSEIQGREFSLNVLADGTIIMTCHFLANDAANEAGYTYSKIFRSTDNSSSWSEQRIGPDGFSPGARTMADWTTFELLDLKARDKSLTVLADC